jgi:hypothetical protein
MFTVFGTLITAYVTFVCKQEYSVLVTTGTLILVYVDLVLVLFTAVDTSLAAFSASILQLILSIISAL